MSQTQTISEIVAALPKPETLKEQYMYQAVCAVAGEDPQYGVAAREPFKREEQYWRALWQALAARFAEEETAETTTTTTTETTETTET